MLKTSPIGDLIIELSEIDSTNNYAMRLINEGMAEHGMTIRADFQTNGKGQHGNVWQAQESKNLLCSIILDTHGFQLEKQFLLNTMACLAVAETLVQQYFLQDVSIKWPNDIYAGKRKIAGILIENQIRGITWSHAVIGIGLNINQNNFEDLNRATSISIETNKQFKIKQVNKVLLKWINIYFQKFSQNETDLLKHYNQLLLHVGEEINFKRNFEYFKGKLLGVNADGRIEIEINSKIKKFQHREIELILS
ncbi:MAG: biotin--[acetyl-CoA-carboxylase] ligase [Chitinophagaceae bacterium]|nr:biotin--[acetyl-CoA-carboxylase] ligase [Chitinophagaceae bacterium]